MSEFRTGALSTFPDSLDQFAIKRPFGGGDPNSKELASHFNHYFDAAIKLEEWAMENLGGPVQTRNPDGYSTALVTDADCRIATVSVTVPLSGDVTKYAMTVPDFLGSDPFNDVRFSVGVSARLVPDDVGAVAGIWANNDWGGTGPLNLMMRWPQIYAMVEPVSGRNFNLVLAAKGMAAGFEPVFANEEFSDTFDRSTFPTKNGVNLGAYKDLGPTWSLSNKNGSPYAVVVERLGLSGTKNSLALVSEEGSVQCYGLASPAGFGESNDQEIEFELHDFNGIGLDDESRSSVGFVVRSNLSQGGLNGYAVLIGNEDYDTGSFTGWQKAQLVLLTGFNTSTAVRGAIDIVGADATCIALTASGYTLKLNEAGTAYKYKLKVAGSTITLEESVAGGPWSVVLTATDGSSTYTRGRPAAFSKARTGVELRAHYFTGVAMRGLDPLTRLSVKANLLYARTGVDGINVVDAPTGLEDDETYIPWRTRPR